jgi:HSP20 family protein
MPRVDVSESENEYEVTAELPGIDEKDVEVVIADNVLTIAVRRRPDEKRKTRATI